MKVEFLNIEIVEGDQLPDTPAHYIKHFEIDGNKVRAVFVNKKQVKNYITKFSTFHYSETWYDKIGFADFSVDGNTISASSTYHPVHVMMQMFKDGLKHT